MGTSISRPTAYDQNGLNLDNREIHTPPITHLVATIKEGEEGSRSPKHMIVYTRVSSPDTDTRQDKSSDSARDMGSDLESTQPHASIHSDTVLLDLDIAQTRLAVVEAPDSDAA